MFFFKFEVSGHHHHGKAKKKNSFDSCYSSLESRGHSEERTLEGKVKEANGVWLLEEDAFGSSLHVQQGKRIYTRIIETLQCVQ